MYNDPRWGHRFPRQIINIINIIEVYIMDTMDFFKLQCPTTLKQLAQDMNDTAYTKGEVERLDEVYAEIEYIYHDKTMEDLPTFNPDVCD